MNELLQPLIIYASELDNIPGIDSPVVTAIVNRLVIEDFIGNYLNDVLAPSYANSKDVLTKLFIERINQHTRFTNHF